MLCGGLFYSVGKRLKEQIEQLTGGDSLEAVMGKMREIASGQGLVSRIIFFRNKI